MSAIIGVGIYLCMMTAVFIMMQSPLKSVIPELSDALPIFLISLSLGYGLLLMVRPNVRPFGWKNHYALELFIFCVSISGFIYSQGDPLLLLLIGVIHLVLTTLLVFTVTLFILPFIALWRYYKQHGHVYQ